MRLLIQRVNHAEVKVDEKLVGSIGKGLLVFVGVGREDTKEIADKYLKKLLGLRIFQDSEGKTNLSLADVKGSLLIVSQVDLCTRTAKRAIVPKLQTESGDPAFRQKTIMQHTGP